MISGPSATLGIMLRLTSSGIVAISSQRDQENTERKRNADHHRQHIAAEDLDGW